MVNLREKAHARLQEHRAGRGALPSPVSARASPADDRVDELAALGGSTRVVRRIAHGPTSPSSPGASSAPALSPTTTAHIVPVPLPGFEHGAGAPVHPGVIEYVRTWAQPGAPAEPAPYAPHAHSPHTHSPHTQLSPHALAAASGYAFPAVPASAGHGAGAGFAHAPEQPPAPAPAYSQFYKFPVFDYGASQGAMAVDTAGAGGYAHAHALHADAALYPSPLGDGTQESPHSTWNAFVAQLGM
jgi:hypothetical protein